jgi:membrane-associated phospholipid phosphatase
VSDGRRLLTALIRADREMFDWFARQHNPVLDRAMPALSHAADHGVLWLGVAGLLVASGKPTWRRAAARGTASLAIASLTANVVAKLSIRRPRPPLDGVLAARRLRRPPVTTSFPSGHTSSAAAFTAGAAREAPELALPLGVLAAGVGLSRVWTGAHYPGDVLTGTGLGVAVAFALPRRLPFRKASARGDASPRG